MAKIKNINGTTQNTCKCTSWLRHWEIFSKRKANYCSEKSCIEKKLVGAHVQKADSSDMRWYIVPLCQTHNKSEGTLDIGTTDLVSANVSETCGKK